MSIAMGPATPEHFLATIGAYREDLVVAVECIFTWYWVADLCAQEGIAFVLGHALYMKAIRWARRPLTLGAGPGGHGPVPPPPIHRRS